MHRRIYLATLASTTSVGVAGCSALSALGDDPCARGECDVGMSRNEFLPTVYEVHVGDTVVWKNTSEADHTVTAYEHTLPAGAAYFATGGYDDEASARRAWDDFGGRLGPRETFSHTFELPGTYGYVCIPHEPGGMVGEIVVTE